MGDLLRDPQHLTGLEPRPATPDRLPVDPDSFGDLRGQRPTRAPLSDPGGELLNIVRPDGTVTPNGLSPYVLPDRLPDDITAYVSRTDVDGVQHLDIEFRNADGDVMSIDDLVDRGVIPENSQFTMPQTHRVDPAMIDGDLNPDLRHPQITPDTHYTVTQDNVQPSEHITNSRGDTAVSATVVERHIPQTEQVRHWRQSTQGLDRGSTGYADDGGHGINAAGGGDPTDLNITAQERWQNQHGPWRQNERIRETLARAGEHLDLVVQRVFGPSQRPIGYVVSYRKLGGTWTTEYFSNMPNPRGGAAGGGAAGGGTT